MLFIEDTAQAAAEALSDSIVRALDKHSRVLLLVPGGSNIQTAVAAMRLIPEDLTQKLHIMLTDERYGPVDHADSNFRQLKEAGFDPKKAVFLPCLSPGSDLVQTANSFAADFARESSAAGYVIALFGMGADGHIAGILPDSAAAAETQALAVGYRTSEFERVTLSFAALKCIDEAYTPVYGSAKQTALKNLFDGGKDVQEQPARILRQIPETYVYNDCIAGEV